ncbi:disease resistance protein RPV1-like [Mangifera indica]|uniref:disease resistance protein RPV1-like n=1 Tax=Mangifera indica TaxID=29780 RepID=UPI001CF93075|nr:disease resistance protein RPV1-like [Mangifera indica]
MASSSSSSQVKYDVFLSFRGEDTRDNFTSHLNAALCRRKIVTFIDDQLVRGDGISPSLLNAISGSKISIIIFSKGYASSTWCLQELVEILNCKRVYGQIVIPVFYHVDPSVVRKQSGTYGDAFGQHEVKYMEEKEMLQRWRNALTEAANLSGFDSNSIRPESKLVDAITECILGSLNDKSYSDNKNLVGVAMKIDEIKSLLSNQSSKVCKVGLWGMGGIGKTTLAEAVFNEISSQFEASYFARNVREEASSITQLRHLKKEFLHAILGDKHLDIKHTFTKERLGRKKVLIVFDDVTDSKQIKELIEDPEDLGSGSQIIITARYKQVLKICRLDDSTIYEVGGLGSDESLRLFTRHAFKQNHPIAKVYLKLSEKVISYTRGLPLALEVLGNHLLGKEKLEWDSALEDLQKSPDEGIQKVLKISYDGLSDKEKILFLDIACFFKGWDKYLVGTFSSHSRIRDLVDKALISVSFTTIGMHDLIQEMGWEIVRQESINKLGQRSRLWHHDDVYHVLKKNLGTDEIRGMLFNMAEMTEIDLKSHAFSKMTNLRVLVVKHISSRDDNKIHGFDSIEFDFSELECLCWNYYPFKSLPSEFDPDNLVVLKMQNNNLKRLWTGSKNLANLKYIDLSYSEHLLEVPDLSKAPHLERLILEDCTSLVKITPPSRNLNKLVELNLRNCKSLICLPIRIQSESLRDVILSGCSNLITAPRISCEMKRLCLDGTAIRNLSSSIESSSILVELNLKDCLSLESLPSTVCNLTSLRRLDLSGLSNLKMVPEFPPKILELYLDETAIKELSSSIGKVSSLIRLSLKNCSSLESLPNTICKLNSLKYICISGCSKLERLPDDLGKLESLEGIEASGITVKVLPSVMTALSALRFLRRLELNYCSITELPNNIDNLSLLVDLELEGNNFETIPTNIMNLSKLQSLNIRFCDRLRSLPKLPRNIKELLADGCKLLKELSVLTNLITPGPDRRTLNLFNCVSLDWDAIRNILFGSILNTFSSKIYHFAYKVSPKRKSEFCYPQSIVVNLEAGICYLGSDIPEWFNIQSSGSVIPFQQFGISYPAGSDIPERLNIRSSGSFRLKREVEICYPGSDIPEWFNIQSSGSDIKLPQGSFNEKVLGLAFCFIVEVEDNSDQCNFFGVGSLLRRTGPYSDRHGGGEETYLLTKCVKSDHVLVIYDRIIWEIFHTEDFNFACDKEASFFFYPLYGSGSTKKNWIKNIKKCGIRLLFTDELEEIMKGSGRSIYDEERGFKSSNFYKGESSSRRLGPSIVSQPVTDCMTEKGELELLPREVLKHRNHELNLTYISALNGVQHKEEEEESTEKDSHSHVEATPIPSPGDNDGAKDNVCCCIIL